MDKCQGLTTEQVTKASLIPWLQLLSLLPGKSLSSYGRVGCDRRGSGRIRVIWAEIGDFKASIWIFTREVNYKAGSELQPKATRNQHNRFLSDRKLYSLRF